MERNIKRTLVKEFFFLIFAVLPVVILAFVVYALFEMAEVVAYPDAWSKIAHVAFFLALFGYLVRLLMKFARLGEVGVEKGKEQ
ncbi:MAG: hypothetical protein PHW14_03060 [Candidatus Omnitrophica bacterium]|nr:hypothetical protein [Candidatus Omnitrophota bacterium]